MHPKSLPLDGGCRCGRVRLRISAKPLLTMACHCTGCQRMTGGPYSLSAAIPTDGFVVTKGETVVGGLRSPTLHHHFCADCMSWLFTRMNGMDTFVNLRPTMLDDPSWFAPYVETCTDERLLWAKTPALHRFPKFPPFDLFAALVKGYASLDGKEIRDPTVVGDTDGTFAILQSDGAAASFIDGTWQPGIGFDSRDFLAMSRIQDTASLDRIRGEASDALAKSLEH